MTRSPDHPIPQPDHPIKVLVAAYSRLALWTAPAWFTDRLRAEFPQLDITQIPSGDHLSQELADATVLFGGSFGPEHLREAKQLRWIHSPAAAVHDLLIPELVNSEIILTNAREVHGVVVAEQVMAMMFALARRIPESVRFQVKRTWGQEILSQEHRIPHELGGATLGLVGLGSIGRNVASRASAMGMKVIAVREHADRPKPEHINEVLPTSQLDKLLSRSDYVVLSPPVTPATRGMIGRAELAAMKRDGYLINVGRGPLVDEAALIEALRSRQIAGAALDVFDQEPLPPESPLWDLENLLITPHTGGMTNKMWDRHYTVFADNLRRFLSGQSLLAVVDKRVGY
jgi:phosphoglycerate dehydrogenase-like enzyme